MERLERDNFWSSLCDEITLVSYDNEALADEQDRSSRDVDCSSCSVAR